jgi:hypothetical protein
MSRRQNRVEQFRRATGGGWYITSLLPMGEHHPRTDAAIRDRDGNPRRTGAGKIEYARMLNFDGRAVADAFGDAVIEALLTFDPTVFNNESAA